MSQASLVEVRREVGKRDEIGRKKTILIIEGRSVKNSVINKVNARVEGRVTQLGKLEAEKLSTAFRGSGWGWTKCMINSLN